MKFILFTTTKLKVYATSYGNPAFSNYNHFQGTLFWFNIFFHKKWKFRLFDDLGSNEYLGFCDIAETDESKEFTKEYLD